MTPVSLLENRIDDDELMYGAELNRYPLLLKFLLLCVPGTPFQISESRFIQALKSPRVIDGCFLEESALFWVEFVLQYWFCFDCRGINAEDRGMMLKREAHVDGKVSDLLVEFPGWKWWSCLTWSRQLKTAFKTRACITNYVLSEFFPLEVGLPLGLRYQYLARAVCEQGGRNSDLDDCCSLGHKWF